MRYRRAAVLMAALAVLAILGACLPASAHHGGAAYDHTKMITVKGTITDFKFINPHVQIYFDSTDDKGNVTRWACESPDDPAMLSRQGWTRHSLNIGDKITIVGYPAKSGANVMSMRQITLASGQVLTNLILNN